MSARDMAEAVGRRFQREAERDTGERTAPHGDPMTVTEAEEQGVLARRRPTGETVEIEVVSHPRQIAEKALGKGAHPDAIRRLFELWPEALVEVVHERGRHDGVDSMVTTVMIGASPSAPATETVYAEARCRLDHDVWVRQHGIGLAFRRALKMVKAVEDLRVMGGAAPLSEASGG